MAWYESLYQKQKDAIESDVTNVAVVAGPGTGKTRTLLHKARQLVETEAATAKDIQIANFTNAGVYDLRKKIADDLDMVLSRSNATTFHSLALGRLLKENDPSIPKPLEILDDWEERTYLDRFAKDKLNLANVRQAKKRRDDYNSRWCIASDSVEDWLSDHDRKAYEGVYTTAKDLIGFVTRGELPFLCSLRRGPAPCQFRPDFSFEPIAASTV